MLPTAEKSGVLIPDCEAPPKRRKNPFAWAPDEIQFADWLLQAWNDSVGKVGGKAFNVRGNRGAAVRFYRRIAESTPDAHFTHESIAAGLKAYAENPANLKLQSWKIFREFFGEGEDLLAKQLKRIGHENAPSADPTRAAAAEIINHNGLGDKARHAATCAMEFQDWVTNNIARLKNSRQRDTATGRSQLQYFEWCDGLIKRFRSLTSTGRKFYRDQAEETFENYFKRKPKRETELKDRNLCRAITIALIDRQAKNGSLAAVKAAGAKP